MTVHVPLCVSRAFLVIDCYYSVAVMIVAVMCCNVYCFQVCAV